MKAKNAIELRDIVWERSARFTISIHELFFPSGKLCAVLGPSGAGKSSLVSILSGEVLFPQGHVTIHGETSGGSNIMERAKNRAVLRAEQVNWLPLSVKDVIKTGAYSRSNENNKNNKSQIKIDFDMIIHAYLKRLDLDGYDDISFDHLSSGQKQRVNFLRTLVQGYLRDPFALILDEPFSHQDAGHANQMLKLIYEFIEKGGTVVMVLHDLTLASQICEYFVLINNGMVKKTGTRSKVLDPALLHTVYGATYSKHGKMVFPNYFRGSHAS